LGALFGAAVFVFRRRAGAAVAAVLAMGILAAPLITATVLKPKGLSPRTEFVSLTVLHRLYIWEFAAKTLAEHPVRGWGMNASRVLPGGKEVVFDDFRQMKVGQVMPLHPHNLALQMWLELGLPGALLAGALVVAVFLRLTRRRLERGLSALACGQFAAGFVISSFSFGAWQSWWLAALWLAASLTAIIGRASDPPGDPATMRRPPPG
jgi:O-antigen ligase